MILASTACLPRTPAPLGTMRSRALQAAQAEARAGGTRSARSTRATQSYYGK